VPVGFALPIPSALAFAIWFTCFGFSVLNVLMLAQLAYVGMFILFAFYVGFVWWLFDCGF
jgi:hypothetical protein